MQKSNDIRCPNCNKKIAEAVGPTDVKCLCPRCKIDFSYNNTATKEKVVIVAKMEN